MKVVSIFWHTLDGVRKVLHLILLLLLFAIVLAALSPRVRPIPSGSALVLAPFGNLVEQQEGDPLERALEQASDRGAPMQAEMRALLRAVTRAASDRRIEALVLDLDGLGSGGLSKLQELSVALEEFKASGKPIVAMSTFYGQEGYYLAAHANEVYLHPMGAVFLDGYDRYRMFYKDALDKISADWHVFRAGEFKSFGEPFTRNDMSEEDKRASKAWLDALWEEYLAGASSARGMDVAELQDYVSGFVDRLEKADGNLGLLAVESGLVDGLMPWPGFIERMQELVGEDEDGETYRQVHYLDYLDSLDMTEKVSLDGDKVGVIVASGSIVGGEQPPGVIGSESMARLIRRAREDESVKAVVLRIDSGGGSSLASEFIREELGRLQQAGKPLVVSMSSVAASGGYWIAMSADEIWANSTTLTGSIGVVAMFPTFPGTLEKLGLHVDGVGTTQFSGTFRPDRPLTEPARAVFQLMVNSGYRDFVNNVAEARNMEPDRVDELGRGRVWTGAQAMEAGLVDRLGSLQEAVASAAALAGLEEYRLQYIEQEIDPAQRLLISLLQDLGLGPALSNRQGWARVNVGGVLGKLLSELDLLARFNDPRGMYYHCFCGDQ